MNKFKVQILETNVYFVEVEAEDSESAVDLAYLAFDYDDQPDSTDAVAELVTNLDTAEEHYRT